MSLQPLFQALRQRCPALVVFLLAAAAALVFAHRQPEPPLAPETLSFSSVRFEYAGEDGYKYHNDARFFSPSLVRPFDGLRIRPTNQQFPDRDWTYRFIGDWFPSNDSLAVEILVYDDHITVDGVSYVWEDGVTRTFPAYFGMLYQWFDVPLVPYE